VPPSAPAPGREPARRAVGVPDDVGVVAVLPSPDGTGPPAAVLEAFQRARVIFTGARLVLIGAPAAPPGGTVALPGRDGGTIANALAAADVAVATGHPSGFDPGVVLALRAGLPTVVPTAAADPAGPALRGVDPGDAGELASVLADLLADPAERRTLGDSARKYAERFDPARLAAELEAAGLLGRP
jgi:glycosyltransferase involved in cell wall biosynthesis